MDDIRPAPNSSQPNQAQPNEGGQPNGSGQTVPTAPNLPANQPPVVSPGPVPDFGGAPKRSRKKLLWLVVILLLVAFGAAAYYFLIHKSSDSSNAAATTSSKKDVANLRFVTTDYGWDTFYPGADPSANYLEANLTAFEGLVRYENKTQVVPQLASSWTNPDNTTWVFNLKHGVKFHTGREMKAQDVKLSFDAAKDSDWASVYADSIASVSATGEYQVTIKTTNPDPTLLKKLVNYFVYDTKSGKTNDAINGTGPFVVKPGTTPTENSLELVAFDGYHGGHVYVRSLTFKGQDDLDASKAFNENKADIIDAQVTGITRAHDTVTVDPTSVFLLPLNTKKAGSPLANLKVRQAINLAVNPAVLATVRHDDAEPIGQLVPAIISGYNPEITRPSRDVAKAKQLLKDAGYPNGTTLTFTYYAPSQATAEEIAKQLAEAGITLKLDPISDIPTLGKKAEGGGTDMYFQSVGSDIFDASDVLSHYDDSANYTNQKVVSLVTEAQTTFDSTKRLDLLKQASKEMADDLGVIPVYTLKSSPITYDSSLALTRDSNTSINLGIYWFKVYGK